jgi:molybdopterin/thiamine biosynthesis adenylyltransferase
MDISVYENGRISRHQGILTAEEQEKIREAVICGAGAGGAGGWTYEALARMGVQHFRIADPSAFDPSNANRQMGSGFATMEKNKAEVVAERLRAIAPQAAIEVFPDGVTAENVERFLDGGSVVVDGVDLYALEAKKLLYDGARQRGLPVFSSPVLGFGTALALFHPTQSPSFEEYFGNIPDRQDRKAFQRYIEQLAMGYFGFRPKLNWKHYMERVHSGQVPSIGTSCMVSGAAVAVAAADWLLGRKSMPAVPATLHIDLIERKVIRTGRLRRFLLRTLSGLYLRWIQRRS